MDEIPIEVIGAKICTRCKKTKPLTAFSKHAREVGGLRRWCRVCSAADRAAYRAANSEKEKAGAAAYRAKNPEKTRARRAAYRAENLDKEIARNAAWRAANPEKSKACTLEWHAANPERLKAKHAAWRAANNEVCRMYKSNRRARKLQNGGTLSKGLSAKLFNLQRGKCACCGLPLGDDYHLDHRMPLALGGANADSNMQLLRATCNLQKNAKHPIDYMQSKGFLL